MNFGKVFLSFIILLLFVGRLGAQQTFYDVNTIQKIEIHFDQPNWDFQMDTAYAGTGGYTFATWIKLNGVQLDSVGVKYKGNSSYDSTYIKNPLHIALDEFRKQDYQDVTDIKLGNNYADPSMLREVLSYQILKNYMDCPRSNFAELYINDVYIGLYANDESINKDFCSAHFNSRKNTFIKCNPIINPGPSTKSNLKYLGTSDSTAYFNYYEIKSDNGWADLVAVCDSVTNHASTLENTFDMDRVIWMLAFNNVLVNLDSYTGVFCQNYYLYKDKTLHYNPIIWDLNMSLGGFPFVGNLNNSMGSLTVTNMQQLAVNIHAADPYWPLINVVMNNAMYKRMYIAHMRTIVSDEFANNNYITTATNFQQLIDSSALLDTNMFFSYTQFQLALTNDYPFASYTVPGIANLMSQRVNYLNSTTEFGHIPPSIDSVSVSDTLPDLYSSVNINAVVTNTNAVYIGYRYNYFLKFIRVPMYDDGLHNDGAANDNKYGAIIPISSAAMQYYIYAENNDAGIFSPERAEHEFYSLTANSTTAPTQFSIYPNPANGAITILPGENENMDFEIYNSLGALVYKNRLANLTTIETKTWQHGVYFFKVGSTVKKVVVMHP